jgi:hypothetical protein
MCILYANVFDTPSAPEVASGWQGNPHGAGVAWIDGGLVKWVKGIDSPAEAYRVVRDVPLPSLLHLRLASAGGYSPLLTHPFPVTSRAGLALRGGARTVLAHNGHVHGWSDEVTSRGLSGEWSDTRLMALLLARSTREFEAFAGRGQRVAVLDAAAGLRVVNPMTWKLRPEDTGGYWQSAHSMLSFAKQRPTVWSEPEPEDEDEPDSWEPEVCPARRPAAARSRRTREPEQRVLDFRALGRNRDASRFVA